MVFMNWLPRASAVLILGLVLSACATPEQILRETSSPERPKWIDNTPKSGEKFYFTGIATNASTREEGEEAALKAAIGKVASSIGIKIQTEFTEKATESNTAISSNLSAQSSAKVVGAAMEDTYYEKIARVGNGYRIEKYDVYVLMSISQKRIDAERQRQREEKTEKAMLAYKLFVSGEDNAKKGNLFRAQRDFLAALKYFGQIDESVALHGSASFKTSEELSGALKIASSRIIDRVRRVAIEIAVPPEEGEAFSANLSMALTSNGFKIVAKPDAFILLKGSVRVGPSGKALGLLLYKAEGKLSCEHITTGEVAAAVAVEGKGFHEDAHQAAMSAMTDAGKDAGEKLAAALLKKEQNLAEKQ